MPYRLHRDRAFRRWLGARAGGDDALGDRLLRRGFHLGAAVALAYYILPPGIFVLVTTEQLLLLGLAVVLGLEALRLAGVLEIPTLRQYEAGRPASYAFYAVAIVVAILVFPEAIAVVVVLGTAAIDPLIGELRLVPRLARRWYPAGPLVAYGALAAVGLDLVGRWAAAPTVAGAAVAAVVAVAAERPKIGGVDDDLAMTLAPAAALVAVALLVPGAALVWPPL